MRSIVCFLFLSIFACSATAEQHYLFSYFKGNGEDGLHLAHSVDGISWSALNHDRSFLTPELGTERLMRDPSITQGPDGKFHMVWTTGWNDRGIGLAHSNDLKNWSEQKRIGVMDHEPKCRNCWAPEIFYDAENARYLIFWASTIEGRFPGTAGSCESGLNHRMYYVTTRDFETFSETRLFFDPGFAVIDSFLVKSDDRFVLVTKDETKFPEAQKNLFVATAAKAEGPYEVLDKPFTPNWVEGPAVLKVDNRWLVYFDEYTRHRYQAMQTSDFRTWESAPQPMTYPAGMRHGTAFQVDGQVAEKLLEPRPVADSPTASAADIVIDVDQPTVDLSPHLYGLFFEDINYAADGGLYAELVQNRSFEYYEFDYRPEGAKCEMGPLHAWRSINPEGARVSMNVVDKDPLNDRNTNYLQVEIAGKGMAGVSNSGFDGMPIDQGAKYDFSVFARTADWRGEATLRVRLQDGSGQSCGELIIERVGHQWKKYEGEITATRTADDVRLVITTPGNGRLHLDMVSLFPQDTWKGRNNGLRKDLVQTLKELNPKTFRFPGGCIVHGHGLANVYNWKDTVGPLETRKPNFNLWGYHQSYGLGFYEYFLLCEDLGMAALPVVPIGVGCGFRCTEFVPLDEMGPHIQDALDLVEFANGPTTSKWGGLRAAMGHPEPFNMKFICLGNEEHDTPQMRERFSLFAKALRENYPEIKIIGTSGLGPGIPIYNLMTQEKVHSSDEHYYEQPEWFIRNQNRFDSFDRSKPKIFVGEYASWGSTLFNALAEAAYLTGIERNADIVDMTCYAPLFGRRGNSQWNPDMIYFDNRNVLKTANYYVQQLFGQNKGDVYLSSEVKVKYDDKVTTTSGAVGIGSWNTAIEIGKVSVNGVEVDPSNWKTTGGHFEKRNGVLVQTDTKATPALSLGSRMYSGENVTYSVRGPPSGWGRGFSASIRRQRNRQQWLLVERWGLEQYAARH